MFSSVSCGARSRSRRWFTAAALGCAALLLTGCIAPALAPSVLDSGEDGLPEDGWHPKLNEAQKADCRSCHKEGAEKPAQ